jgi:hypothetical protein
MPPARRKSIGLPVAAEAAALDPDDLLRLLDEIRTEAAAGAKVLEPPQPTNEDGEPVWDWDDYRLWAMRMGYWSPIRGRRLIGYAGIAWLTNVSEQWLYKMQGLQAKRPSQLEDMPSPITEIEKGTAGFDLVEILRWARQTGRTVRRTS